MDGSTPQEIGNEQPVIGAEGLMNPTVSYEHSDVRPLRVSAAVVGVLLGVLFFSFAMWFVFTILKNHSERVTPRRLPLASEYPAVPVETRMEEFPEESLRQNRQAEQRILDGYSWVDREKGIVAIPVGKAMDIVARRGLPPARLPAGIVLSRPAEGTQHTGFEGKALAPPQ